MVITALIVLQFLASISFSVDLVLIDDIMGVEYEMLGQSCEGLGDVNGDGYSDFLISSRGFHELMLYLGGPKPFDSMPKIIWPNHATAGGLRSFSPVNVGDVDCDGANDFISLFGDDDTLKLFLGLENLDPDDYLVLFADSSDKWYFNIAGGGDNNNDGNPDIWVRIYNHSTDTIIYGYSGCDLLDTIYDFVITYSRAPDLKYLGLAKGFCNTCDLNGDSVPEVIYGQTNSYEPYRGRIGIVWGDETLSTTADLLFYAPNEDSVYTKFGTDLACMGDINGDGIDDLWVSQIKLNYIYYGGRPFDTIPDLVLYNPFMYGNMENAGDINNDGCDDAAMVYEEYLFSYISYIYCYPDMDTLVDAVFSDQDFVQALGIGPVTHLGIDYSRGGDINGDGLNDILVSAHKWNDGGEDEGRFFIQSGWQDPVSAEEGEAPIPSDFTLKEFTLPRSGYTELRIYNILGELVATPIQQHLLAGEHHIAWDGLDMNGAPTPAGVYFYQVTSGDYTAVRKMVLLK
jgi:hypothetical protein